MNFFTDRFWVDTFEYLSTNNRTAGEAISLEDLKERCKLCFAQIALVLGDRAVTIKNEENLILGLKNTIKELL